MASGNSAMMMETGAGWTRGLRNMLRGELGAWFGTRTWLDANPDLGGCDQPRSTS